MINPRQGRSDRRVATTALAATLAAFTLFVAGCGDNSGNPTGYSPEGQASPALLLLDVQPLDVDTTQVYVLAAVMAPPPSDGFSFYVNPDDAGFRALTDSPIHPTTTFDSGWSLFQTLIEGFDPTTTNLALLGRGSRGGIESVAAPVTSAGYIPATHPLALTRRQPVELVAPADSAVISEPGFSWVALPGASGYLLQAVSATTGELGLLVYMPENGSAPTELEVSVLNRIPYYWWVMAFDGGGRAFGLSPLRQFSFVPASAGASPGLSRVQVRIEPASAR